MKTFIVFIVLILLTSCDKNDAVSDKSIAQEEFYYGDEFHKNINKVYSGNINWAVFKKDENMAKVLYEPAHPNQNYSDYRKGEGKLYSKWIFSEEPETQERIFTSNFDLLIEAELEPNASIGLHKHLRTEEIYYVIDGDLLVYIKDDNGELEESIRLNKGDAHMVRIGQSHACKAGEYGAKFLTIGIRGNNEN